MCIRDSYSPSEWNIYGAQASDGDNWEDDSANCKELMINSVLPNCQYYSYIEITPRNHQSLWHTYEEVEAACPDQFAMQHIVSAADIYPVFRELFHKRVA